MEGGDQGPQSQGPGTWDLLEIVTVALWFALPSFVVGLKAVLYGPDQPWPFHMAELSHLAVVIPVILVLLILMRASGVPWAEYGIVRPRLADGLVAVAFVLVYAFAWEVYAMAAPAEEGAEQALGVVDTPGGWEILLALLSVPVIALSEELLVRGFLVPRITRRAGPWLGVLIPAAVFAIAHLYQGWWAVLMHFLLAVLLCSMFLAHRRLFGFALGHALVNYVFFLAA